MLFLTLGTDLHPFERALDLVEPFVGREPVVVQNGHTPPRLEWVNTTWFPFAPYEELVGLMGNARRVVCSAGVGAIMTALGLGIRPVTIARLGSRGEHVDDHQLQIAEALGRLGLVVVWAEGESAENVLEGEPAGATIARPGNSRLGAAVHAAAAASV